jgi:hypothetical protein
MEENGEAHGLQKGMLRGIESPTKSHRMHTFSQMFVEKNYSDLSSMQSMLDQSLSSGELIMFRDQRG